MRKILIFLIWSTLNFSSCTSEPSDQTNIPYELLDSLIDYKPRVAKQKLDSLRKLVDDDNHELLKLRVDYHVRQYEYEQGLALIDRVIKNDSTNGELYFHKGIMIDDIEGKSAAEIWYKKAYENIDSFDSTEIYFYFVLASGLGTEEALSELNKNKDLFHRYIYYVIKNEIELYNEYGFKNTLKLSEGELTDPFLFTWNSNDKRDSLISLGVTVAKNSTSVSDSLTVWYAAAKYQTRIDSLIKLGILKSL